MQHQEDARSVSKCEPLSLLSVYACHSLQAMPVAGKFREQALSKVVEVRPPHQYYGCGPGRSPLPRPQRHGAHSTG